MKYRFLSPALKEISTAADYYEIKVTGLGGDFIIELEFAIARILQFPYAWSEFSDGFRHCNLRRFPYSII